MNSDSRSRDKGRTRKTKAGLDGDTRSGNKGRTRKTKAGPVVNRRSRSVKGRTRQTKLATRV